MNFIKKITLFLGVVLLTSACAKEFQTSYNPDAVKAVGSSISVKSVNVIIPTELKVNDTKFSFTTPGDIVWQGEPKGDRKAQVSSMFNEAAINASRSNNGNTPVVFQIELLRFHGISKRAYNSPVPLGVYNILMNLKLIDPSTGAIIAEDLNVRADIEGLTKRENPNITDHRQYVVDHLTNVFNGWLDGNDSALRSFTRIGH